MHPSCQLDKKTGQKLRCDRIRSFSKDEESFEMNGNGGGFVPAEQMGFCSQQRWNMLTVVECFFKMWPFHLWAGGGYSLMLCRVNVWQRWGADGRLVASLEDKRTKKLQDNSNTRGEKCKNKCKINKREPCAVWLTKYYLTIWKCCGCELLPALAATCWRDLAGYHTASEMLCFKGGKV